jgi:thiol:disulfide interchange protein
MVKSFLVNARAKSYGPNPAPSSGHWGFARNLRIAYNRLVVKNPMFKPAWGLFVLLLIVAAVGVASHLREARDLVPWRTDLAAARTEAAAQSKPLFLDFGASWCPDCRQMTAMTWSDPSVAGALARYVPVSIDVDAHPDLASQYQIKSIPAVFVVDPKTGQIVKENRDGALPPADFLHWLGESGPR